MKALYTLILIFLLCLTGCSTLGGKFVPVKDVTPGKALIYVYRVPRFAGSAASPYLCLSGQVVGEVVDGGYFTIQVEPGTHKVSFKSLGLETNGPTLKAKAGSTYFLRSDFSSLKEGTGGGLVGDAIWGSGKDEKSNILANVDTSAQEPNDDPSLVFVKEKFARGEISKTKEFKVPQYEQNYCAKSERAKRKNR